MISNAAQISNAMTTAEAFSLTFVINILRRAESAEQLLLYVECKRFKQDDNVKYVLIQASARCSTILNTVLSFYIGQQLEKSIWSKCDF